MASFAVRSQQLIFTILAAAACYSGANRVDGEYDELVDGMSSSLSYAIQGRLAAEPSSALVQEALSALQALALKPSNMHHTVAAADHVAHGNSWASATAALPKSQLAVAEWARDFFVAHAYENAEAAFLGVLFSDTFEDAVAQATERPLTHHAASPVEPRKTDSLLEDTVGSRGNSSGEQGVLPPTPLSRPCANPRYFMWGDDFFLDVFNDFESLQAGDEVIIAGWLIELFTVNLLGDLATDYSIIIHTLTRAAKRGVKIYVQFWYSHV
jgi:hypothetical protein